MAGESELLEPLGKRIRLFFRDLFGSRVSEHLELELITLRQDYDHRLQDKDLTIATLREEKNLLMSKVTMYEMTIMPRSSRIGAEVVAYQKPTKPNFSFVDVPPPKSKWEMVQEEHEKQIQKEIQEEALAAKAPKG
jgi:hypothetical protein